MSLGADLVIQQGDSRPVIKATIKDGNDAYDLTSHTAKLRIWKRGADNSAWELDGSIQSPEADGIVHFDLPSVGLDVFGVYDIQGLFTDGSSKTIRTKHYRLEVKKALPVTS